MGEASSCVAIAFCEDGDRCELQNPIPTVKLIVTEIMKRAKQAQDIARRNAA